MTYSAVLKRAGTAALLAMLAGVAAAQDHVAIKRPFDLPPSATLVYKLDARQKGIALGGSGTVVWRAGAGKYSIDSSWKASFLGRILENRSEGAIDAYGLAPSRFVEKRFRKSATVASFDRAARVIGFDRERLTYPILGGEQDRSSAQWQLAAIARAAPEKFTPGSEWKFFVAGRRDAEEWTFKVVRRDTIKTGLGSMQALHLVKSPPADSKAQRVDIWLAPGLDWYPVKLRISEEEGEYIEQVITSIDKT